MFPGTTSCESPFLAPSRLPGPGAALLARPWEACEAGREGVWVGVVGGRGWRVRRVRARRRRVEGGWGVVLLERERSERMEGGICGWSIVGGDAVWLGWWVCG